ncbi:MAG: polysaccharide biosynthesis tyrosine autokinase [Myxococcaceae bacterium]|nr:polysaccharide biosynthesis tyrosine autokinase [Myxococcaceae bacterium]MCI0672821.1 polysaccharide biosynthesis tyrosine autokinase [Myxococcaceae bacterium]
MDTTGPESEAGPGAGTIDFKRYLQVVWRRKWLVLVAALAALAASGLNTFLQPRIFAAKTSIVLDLVAPRLLGGQVEDVLDDRASYWTNKEFMGTQYRIMQSRAVAARVVKKLSLQSDAAFLGVEDVRDKEQLEQAMARVDAVGLLQSRISVVPEKDTRLVHIEVQDLDPERAAQLANEVAEAYLAETLSLRLQTTQIAADWLADRLGELEQTSKASELAVYDFKKQADVLSTSLDDRVSIVSARLGAYDAALTGVRTQLAELKARMEAMESLRRQSGDDPRWAEPLVGMGGGSILDDLRGGLVRARTECALRAQRLSADHPELLACQQQVKVLEDDWRRELDNLLKSTRAQQAAAAAQERNLGALLETTKQEAFDVSRKQIEFARLQRDATNNQRLYDVVLKQLKDIELSGLARTSNVRVLDPARPNFTPVSPKVARNLMTGLMLGLILGVGLVLLLEVLDSTLKTQADVEKQLQLPFLGHFPLILLPAGASLGARDLHVLSNPGSSAAECSRAIRTQLLFASRETSFRTLVVTSSGPREGKSTLAISLGVALAQSGCRTLIVDTDLRRPRLHESLGVPNAIGVSTLLCQRGDIEQAIQRTLVPDLFVLPSGPLSPNPAELLHARAFRELLEQLAGRFDRVLLDSPPVNAVADGAVLAAQADAVLLVLKARGTRRESARHAERLLRSVKANLLGAVLNEVDPTETDGRYAGYANPAGGAPSSSAKVVQG